jgi:hypothetical protein
MSNLSKRSWTTHVSLPLALVLGLALESGWQSAQAQSINQRQTTALALIAGTHGRQDGSFAATGKSSVCGEIPKESSITGLAAFVVEFPSDAINQPLQSIAFGSGQLVGGVTKASVFQLNVHVKTAQGATPPGYVLDTDSGNPKNTGTATLTKKGGVTTLKVVGQNRDGETITLTVTC